MLWEARNLQMSSTIVHYSSASSLPNTVLWLAPDECLHQEVDRYFTKDIHRFHGGNCMGLMIMSIDNILISTLILVVQLILVSFLNTSYSLQCTCSPRCEYVIDCTIAFYSWGSFLTGFPGVYRKFGGSKGGKF